MKTRALLCLLVVGMLLSGCAERECETAQDCAERACFAAECKENRCSYTPIADCCGNKKCETGEDYESCPEDCPDCDDGNGCTADSYDYHEQECVNDPITPCCGNGLCDEGAETLADCPEDCPDCDDGKELTGDSFNYTTQECEYVTYHFFEDFDDGTISWLDPDALKCSTEQADASCDPRWGVVFPEEGSGVLTNVNDGQAYTGFGSPGWTDYAFSFRVRRERGPAHAYVRRTEGAYAVTFLEYQLHLWKDMKEPVKLTEKDCSFAPDRFYDVRIEARGRNVKVYVDGALVIDHTDDWYEEPLLSGSIGLEVNGKAYFDDLRVEPLG